jgi:malonate-semialdehyde dehydrogenase (acetylating) / methylmalonate-semialdehyde dehydrogenase
MSQTVTHEGKLLENFVGGRGVAVETDEILDVLDPANGEVLARVPLSTSADVDRAV